MYPQNPTRTILLHWPIFSDTYQDKESFDELLCFLNDHAYLKNIELICPYFPLLKDIPSHGYASFNQSNLIEQLKILNPFSIKMIHTIDMHSTAYQNVFALPIKNYLLHAEMLKTLCSDILRYPHMVVVGPDHGAADRARTLSHLYEIPYFLYTKKRNARLVELGLSEKDQYAIMNGACILIDDLICTGNTLSKTIESLISYKCTIQAICVSHSLHSLETYGFPVHALISSNSISPTWPDSFDITSWICSIAARLL